MYYDPDRNDHGLPHNPFKSCVVPRPIGWISTISPDGVHNLAPYSQFQNLTFDPPYVMFAANQNTRGMRKDTVVNAEQTGEFVYNMATYDLREAVNLSGTEVPPEVDEFELAGLTKAPSIRVKPCRVAESPVQFECHYHQTIRLPGNGIMGTVDIVIGRVVLVHIKDEVIGPDGRLDILRIRPLGRLGYYDYTTVESTFEMVIPGENEDLLNGLEGTARSSPTTGRRRPTTSCSPASWAPHPP
jgi:flavin reductase (DIM6/NTAB) family NADH-FMN oxidoreductase RutF